MIFWTGLICTGGVAVLISTGFTYFMTRRSEARWRAELEGSVGLIWDYLETRAKTEALSEETRRQP